MFDACMISRTGKVYPCEAHPYMDPDFGYMNITAIPWFYYHIEMPEWKTALIDLIAYYAMERFHIKSDVSANLKKEHLASFEGVSDFLDAHSIEIEHALNNKKSSSYYSSCQDLITHLSTQEFMRVRYGGVYHTVPGNREIYFRISSNDFDWTSIVYSIVSENAFFIDYVTVVRDLASTNDGRFYFLDGMEIDQMPIKCFLKNPQQKLML